MQWLLQGIVVNENSCSFLLENYAIMNHKWIPVLDIDVIVIDPLNMKEKKLNVVKIKTEKKEIVFGYLDYVYGFDNNIGSYAIYQQGIENWVFKKIVFENDVYKIRGYNIWDYFWLKTSKERPIIKHPYYDQVHKLEIVTIFVKNCQTIRFAYSEFSNGAYGIYLSS